MHFGLAMTTWTKRRNAIRWNHFQLIQLCSMNYLKRLIRHALHNFLPLELWADLWTLNDADNGVSPLASKEHNLHLGMLACSWMTHGPLLGPSRSRICARPTKIGPCQIVVQDPKKRGLPTKKYTVCIRMPMNSHVFSYPRVSGFQILRYNRI